MLTVTHIRQLISSVRSAHAHFASQVSAGPRLPVLLEAIEFEGHESRARATTSEIPGMSVQAAAGNLR
jgi:hypothetical protein